MFRIALPIYEGKVEELLSLIKKRKLSPLEFEIAKITKAYLEWLSLKDDISLVVASNPLVFLSELLLIKSGVCLPKPPVIETQEDSLIAYIREYQEYKHIGIWIEERIKEQDTKIPVGLKQEDIKEEIDVSISSLFSSLKEILDKRKESPIRELILDEPSLEDAIERIKRHFSDIKKIEISLLLDIKNRLELIVTFLAILELIRLRFLKAIQYRAFSSIWLVKN